MRVSAGNTASRKSWPQERASANRRGEAPPEGRPRLAQGARGRASTHPLQELAWGHWGHGPIGFSPFLQAQPDLNPKEEPGQPSSSFLSVEI